MVNNQSWVPVLPFRIPYFSMIDGLQCRRRAGFPISKVYLVHLCIQHPIKTNPSKSGCQDRLPDYPRLFSVFCHWWISLISSYYSISRICLEKPNTATDLRNNVLLHRTCMFKNILLRYQTNSRSFDKLITIRTLQKSNIDTNNCHF